MPPERPTILEVTGLSLTFSRDAASPNVLDGVSFSVREGETLCIVGESGSGKSVTSLALMACCCVCSTLRRGASFIAAGTSPI
jgi:peptide/nickel transport system ATP-binding protein